MFPPGLICEVGSCEGSVSSHAPGGLNGLTREPTLAAAPGSADAGDHASSDDPGPRVRRRTGVRVIANQENRGFAAAVNQGVREAGQAEFLILLNPDVRLSTSLDALIDAAGRHGLAAGKLLG